MRNKLKENVDWYSIETQKKAYVKIKIEENAMKHWTSRFKKDFIKSFLIVENVFDDLNRMFDDLNKRVNVLKIYKRLKQIKVNKKFHTFWAEFHWLTSDSEFYDEEALLKDLKDKMFWNLQKTLTSNIYKVIDLYKFARFCQFIDQTLRDVNTKFKNIKREYEESTLKKNFNNQESSREQSNKFKSRSETFKSNANNQNLNNREMNQVLAFD
jgi:hypothetical protein